MRKHLTTVLKIIVSLGLMAYLFTKMDMAQVGNLLKTANVWLLIPAALLHLAAMSNSGLKWFVLLRAQGVNVPFKAVLSYTYVGFFFNNFLPANIGGDVMRGYGLARYTEQAAEAAVSVVVDRVVGLSAFLVSALISVVFAAFFLEDQANLKVIGIIAMVGVAAVFGGFAAILSRRIRTLVGRLFEWKPLAPLSPLYERLSSALGAYRFKYKALATAFGLGLITIILTNFTDYLIALSLGGGIPLVYIFVINPIIALVLLVPISIGGLGVSQAVYPFFYGLAGVSPSLAFAVSLLKQLIIYVTSIPGGVLWWRDRAGAGEAQPAAEEPLPSP